MLERAKKHLRNPLSAYLGLILVCMLLLAAIAAVLPGCTSQDVTPQTQTSGIVYDENAIEGGWEQMSQEEIEETLNETVSEGMIRISMNTTPVFEDGDAEGNLMIVNEDGQPLSPAGGDLPQRHQGDHLRRPRPSLWAARSKRPPWTSTWRPAPMHVPPSSTPLTPKPAAFSAPPVLSSPSPSITKAAPHNLARVFGQRFCLIRKL